MHTSQPLLLPRLLVADSAYTNTETVVTPYKKPAANLLPNRRFNKLVSSSRIDIEDAFGLLKNRWSCLKGLRVRINSNEQLLVACRNIMACIVLHNMLISFDDQWAERDEVEPEVDVEDGRRFGAENLAKRERVKQKALRKMYPGQ